MEEQKMSINELVNTCITTLENVPVPVKLMQAIGVPIMQVTGLLKSLQDFYRKAAEAKAEKKGDEKEDGTV